MYYNNLYYTITKIISSSYFRYSNIKLNGLRVLCYHNINNSNNITYSNTNTSIYSFKSQMEYLKNFGFTCLSFEKLHKYLDREDTIPEKSFIITFDDGFKSVYTHAYPILEEHDFYSILFVPTNIININKFSKTHKLNRDFLSINEIVELHKSGRFLIGSHGVSHIPMTKLYNNEIINELKQSKYILESLMENNVNHFAFPNGIYNKRVFNIATSIYKYVYSTKKGLNKQINLLNKPIYRHSINNRCKLTDFVLQLNGGYDWIRRFA